MTLTPQPIKTQPGTTAPGGVRFITQHPIENIEQPFSIDLPGTVYVCDEAVAPSIHPRARIVVPGHRPVRAARISAMVTDTPTLCAEGAELVKRLEGKPPLSLALRFSAPVSFGQVLKSAEEVTGDCRCGCGGNSEASFRGSVSIGVASEPGADLDWSEEIGAIIYAHMDEALTLGGSEKARIIAARDNCSEDWYFWDCKTYCTGFKCTSPEVCKCGQTSGGTPKIVCDGFVRCNCNP